MPFRGQIREKTGKKIHWNPLCFIQNSFRNSADCSRTHCDRKREQKFQLKFTLGLLLSLSAAPLLLQRCPWSRRLLCCAPDQYRAIKMPHKASNSNLKVSFYCQFPEEVFSSVFRTGLWNTLTYSMSCILHTKLQFHKITNKSYPTVLKNQEVPEHPGEYPLSFPSSLTDSQHSGLWWGERLTCLQPK